LTDPARGYLAEGTAIDKPLTLGQEWAEWKSQASARRWIQAQARIVKAGKMTTTQLYRTLAERGLKVKKWSDLYKVERERCESLFGYLACLWEFCGLARKPWGFEPWKMYNEGAKHYADWLEHLHARKELESMIRGVEEIGE
jgi:hypothetical protein